MARTRRNRVCAHEGCKEPGEQYERWGYGFTFCSTHMEHARKVFNREDFEIAIPPDTPKCSRGHYKVHANLCKSGCRACNNAQAWAWRCKITDPDLIQRRADSKYQQLTGATA